MGAVGWAAVEPQRLVWFGDLDLGVHYNEEGKL